MLIKWVRKLEHHRKLKSVMRSMNWSSDMLITSSQWSLKRFSRRNGTNHPKPKTWFPKFLRNKGLKWNLKKDNIKTNLRIKNGLLTTDVWSSPCNADTGLITSLSIGSNCWAEALTVSSTVTGTWIFYTVFVKWLGIHLFSHEKFEIDV